MSKAIRAGAALEVACNLATISEQELELYMKHDVAFHREVKAAEAAVEVRAVGSVRAAMVDDWRAGAWFLQNAGADHELERLKRLTTDQDDGSEG